MVDSVDLHSRKTGITVSVRISKNGTTAAGAGATPTEVDSTNLKGVYYYEPTSGELDTLGIFLAQFTGTNCEPREVVAQIVPWDPYDVAALGLTRLDAAVTTRLAPTVAGRTLDVTATGAAGVDLGNVENPGTVLALSGTTIKDATDVETAISGVNSAIGGVDIAVGNVNTAVAGVASDVADVAVDVADVSDQVLEVSKAALNRWKIDKNTATLTLYEDDGITPFKVYDLKDDEGDASTDKIFERVPQ
jgi:hypothetical protein